MAHLLDRRQYNDGIWLYVHHPNATVRPRPNRAKMEPTYGCYLGAFIDWNDSLESFMADSRNHKDPVPFYKLVGKKHASVFTYVNYGREFPDAWVDRIRQQGAFPHIGWEPNEGLAMVRKDDYLVRFAQSCAAARVPVFLRYASEMNGTWTAYGKDPADYIEKWKLVTSVMRELAPNVIMCWCVNSMPTSRIERFYPGDEWVDWVGVNFYSVPYHNDDRAQPGFAENPTDQMRFVYDKYAAKKPIAICEFGASHMSKVDQKDISDWASRKIIEMYAALPRFYPRVKMACIFDGDALKHAEGGRDLNNYSVSDNEQSRRGYKAAIASEYFLEDVRPKQFSSIIMEIPEAGVTVPAGVIRFSCWARCASEPFAVTYLINGKPVGEPMSFPGPREIGVRFKPGTYTLTGVVTNANGREVARKSRKVIVG